MRKSQLANGDEPLKPVGIWIRVSTEDQAKGESPEHHEKRARAYAESKGWQVREVYHLEGVSGKAVLEHAETKHMLKHIAAGRITGLIFSSWLASPEIRASYSISRTSSGSTGRI